MIYEEQTGNNLPVLTVSDLSFSLKALIEDRFGYVRVRGELSRVTIAKSGHLYSSLKDDNAVLDAICWKGSLGRLSIQPQEGMDVICTGRLTTYPGRSNYQLIIETMELAGQGALLKMLEERKKKLAAEGLFAAERKKEIPFLPEKIGVVTSPTGAVIRDILHRLQDRFPRHVMVWPVMVQGQGAAEQIVSAINGFNNMPAAQRPDLIIVARGGGSLEDLMPFQEEAVVRAAAASKIPLISAVGHETDTTLIDYAADKRAPTPTAAAEFAVPVRIDCLQHLQTIYQTMYQAQNRYFREVVTKLEGLQRGLGRTAHIFDSPSQRLDHVSLSLERSIMRWQERKQAQLETLSSKLRHPQYLLDHTYHRASDLSQRLQSSFSRRLGDGEQMLYRIVRLVESLSFKATLRRGYTLVEDQNGAIITSANMTQNQQMIHLRWADGRRKAILQNGSEK